MNKTIQGESEMERNKFEINISGHVEGDGVNAKFTANGNMRGIYLSLIGALATVTLRYKKKGVTKTEAAAEVMKELLDAMENEEDGDGEE